MTPQDYDAWYERPRGRWIGDAEFALLRRQLDLRPGQKVLDVGCGTGWFTRQLAQAGLQMTGLDLNEQMLTVARQRTPQGITWLQGDAVRLPFADRSFDHVVALTSLSFMHDWPRAVAEIVRVTRGGFALGLLNRQSLLWRKKGQGGGGAYHGAHWHTHAEVDAYLRQMAVCKVRFASAVFLPSATGFARVFEHLIPSAWLRGAFLLVSGEALPGSISFPDFQKNVA